MSTNLKIIKFTAIFSSIFFIITFSVCLNISYEWFEIKWLSNNFLLTIFSGIFASMLVVLVCEIQQYFLNKRKAEDQLYDCFTEILARFISSNTMLSKIEEDSDQILSENLLETLRKHVERQINIYFKIDYTTHSKKNKLFLQRPNFAHFLTNTVQSTIHDCVYLDLAINEAKIKNIKENRSIHEVTSNDENVLKVVQQLKKEFQLCIDQLIIFIKAIDYSKRFNFEKRFLKFQQSPKPSANDSVEDFINKTI